MKMGGQKGKMGGGMGGGSPGGGSMGGGSPGGGSMGGNGSPKTTPVKHSTAAKAPVKHSTAAKAPAKHSSTGAAAPKAVSSSDARSQLVACGEALYNNRGSEHYTEGGSRWQGITDRVRPPNAPTYSDCSSAVSWCYWTVFGGGADILNGDSWQGGYTGTMASHGRAIPCSQMQPGDVALYGSGAPWDHAEMYMGGGRMVSHGADPVSYQSSSSTQGFATMQCRTYF